MCRNIKMKSLENFWSGKPSEKSSGGKLISKYFVQTIEEGSHKQNFKIISRKKEYITHQRFPKTPGQNGTARRINRTLVESVRFTLADATATYLRNRIPSAKVKGKTPFEAWTSRKPSVKHIRAFGREAYAHATKGLTRETHSKARKCIFLAMVPKLTNGYRIYTKNVQECFIVVNFSLINIHSQRTDLVKEQELVYKWNLTFPSLKKLLSTKSRSWMNHPS